MTDNAPKTLIVPHTRPAAPWFPRINDSTVVEPIKAVSAAISIRPPPKFRDEIIGGEFAEFGIFVLLSLLPIELAKPAESGG